MLYPIAISTGDDDHAWGVEVPDIPGCFSAGDDLDDAMAMAREAIEGHFELLAEDGPVNHNLGADTAAYAVIAPELNTLLESLFALDDQLLQSYTLHIDFRMGCDPLFGTRTDEICSGALSGYGKNINNGYEQLFIGTASINREPPTGIPEPGMLFMFSTGLLALRWRLVSRR